MAVVLFNKRYIETLAQSVERFRLSYPQFKESKVTYAGRLDPLAEGLLIMLTDEDVHRKQLFLGLSKVYEVQVILGMSTDTHDVLGIPVWNESQEIYSSSESASVISSLQGTQKFPYPHYSSRTVQGKPLYQWARKGKIHEISIPTQEVHISKIEVLKESSILSKPLFDLIQQVVSHVQGDFRQQEIITSWEKGLPKEKTWDTLSLRMSVSSGTYVRSVVQRLGELLGTGATCLIIKRISVGEYGPLETEGKILT